MRLVMLCLVVGGLTGGVGCARADGGSKPDPAPPALWSADMRVVADGINRFAFSQAQIAGRGAV
jgi:hypothetical protein